jgi:hypothetical protein
MRKNTLFLISALLLVICSIISAQTNRKFPFNEIVKCQSKIKVEVKYVKPYMRFCEVRLKLDSLQYLNFINELDTFFLLESFDVETGVSYISIWNNETRKNFIAEKDSIYLSAEELYSHSMISLLNNWNIKGIRQEEKSNANEVPINYVYGSRVIYKKRWIIDCIAFKEFYLQGRD